ncbi:MAG: cyanophycin synthetase [Candidatus Delongbacteria bacterium]
MSSATWAEIWRAVDARARFGMLQGLERMADLLERLGHPERALRCVQLAGTNGKGAAAYALWRLLEDAGEPAGLFVSPHLLHVSERIRLRGGPLDEAAAGGAWRELAPHVEAVGASYFETLTALALLAFARAGSRWAVLECGLGGRLDATSAVRPELSLLTSVGADHLAVLGPTLADVARDKAHVAPPGGVLISAVDEPALCEIVARVARERGAEVLQVSPCPAPAAEERLGERVLLRGRSGAGLLLPEDTWSWRAAAGLALRAVEQLAVMRPGDPAVVTRLESGEWPGRFHVLRRDPPLVLDVAHNPPALARLTLELAAHWPGARFHVLLAGMADKALADNLRVLAPVAGPLHVLLPAGHGRAASREDWRAAARAAGVEIEGWLDESALRALRCRVEEKDEREPWLVTGSFLGVAAWLGAVELPRGL